MDVGGYIWGAVTVLLVLLNMCGGDKKRQEDEDYAFQHLIKREFE